jgi:hypothetical protein
MSLQGIFGINPQQAVLTRFHKIADAIGNIKAGLYHGAPYFAIQRIASGGYEERGNHMSSLGKGVYLAPIAGKSAQYTQKGISGRQERGVLLDNLVALGKMADASKGTLEHILRSKAWDSVYTGPDEIYHNPEYLVRHASAVLPKYWLDLLIGSKS